MKAEILKSRLIAGAALVLCLARWGLASEQFPAEALEFFEKKVRPVLATHCYDCHGPQLQQGGLRLDSREGVLKGGTRGAAVVEGEPDSSWLIRAVRHQELEMPPAGRLSPEQIGALERWVAMGVPWTEPAAKPGESEGVDEFYAAMLREHWSYQPLTEPRVPGLEAEASGHPVDRFIREGLERLGLQAASPGDRRTLARRLSLVLTGLPPGPEEIDRFVRDPSPDAYERLVDRLFASPHLGERWARHWMDLMRFGETYGYEWNYELLAAWRYRDYLIRAFNQDLPFDQLVREHVAGDLLEQPRIDHRLGLNESIAGAAFFRLGEMGHDNCVTFREIRTDVVDNQIDTLTKAFQGLTVACARCHDHKLDPIPTKDYYALYGILTSSHQLSRTLDTGDSHQRVKAGLKKLKSSIRKELARLWIRQSAQIPDYLLAAQAAQGGSAPASARTADLDPKRLERWRQVLLKESVDPEGILFPWAAISCEAGFSPGRLPQAWSKLEAYYKRETGARKDFNRTHFLDFGDFRSGSLDGWHPDGLGLKGGTVADGALTVSTEGSRVLSGVLPAGLYSHVLSERLNGALRSPYLPKDKKFLSLRLMGGKLASRRTIVDHCILGDDYRPLESDRLSWFKIPIKHRDTAFPIYVELVTKGGNPRLPERPGHLKGYTDEDLASPGSYFGISQAVVHDIEELPREELDHMAPLFQGSPPRSAEQLAWRYGAASRRALTAWAKGKAGLPEVRWIDWLIGNELLENSRDLSPRLNQLVSAYRSLESRLSKPRVISAMGDIDTGYDAPLLEKGDAKRPGDPVPRGYLTLLKASGSAFQTSGSGRRKLAEVIASADNPLTARVMVNRLWHHVFGRGIVATVDDFGRFGDQPSHPELLDYLASRFVKQGWSVKRLLRLLVLSETFRQSSRPSPLAGRVDPENRSLHHYPLRRLEAEVIRDTILAASGRLEPRLYGPSIQPFRDDPKDYRKLLSGPLDGNGRRSLYLKVTRMESPPFLELFDFPAPSATRGRRDRTNVPSQALALLNDSFVVGQAGYWAERLLAEGDDTVEARLERMFRQALGRSPESTELGRFRESVLRLSALHGVSEENILSAKKVWKDVAHAMLNLKELIYLF